MTSIEQIQSLKRPQPPQHQNACDKHGSSDDEGKKHLRGSRGEHVSAVFIFPWASPRDEFSHRNAPITQRRARADPRICLQLPGNPAAQARTSVPGPCGDPAGERGCAVGDPAHAAGIAGQGRGPRPASRRQGLPGIAPGVHHGAGGGLRHQAARLAQPRAALAARAGFFFAGRLSGSNVPASTSAITASNSGDSRNHS